MYTRAGITPRSPALWRMLFALSLLVSAACDDLFLKHDADETKEKPAAIVPVDIAAIKERGVLRLLTRNNGNTYHVLRGRRLGFDYIMAERLARSLGVKLEVIVPANWSDLIPMLRNGQGDIIGAAMNITEGRSRKVLFANPYGLSHIRVVWGPGRDRIRTVDELSGKQIHAREHSTYYALLSRLSALFESVGRAPIDVVIESETLETEQILGDVAMGKVAYSLCDQHICIGAKDSHPNLIIGPSVSDLQPLAWAVHPRAKDLRAVIDKFFVQQRQKDFRAVYDTYYPADTARKKHKPRPQPRTGRISPYDVVFREAVRGMPLDWRLLAAIAYEESQFDPKTRTPIGGRGLFGMLPRQGKQVGATDLYNPKQAAHAAANQLRKILTGFAEVPNDEDRLKFAIAGFQCGVEHIEDAQLVAAGQDHRIDVWSDVAEILPLLSLRQYAAQAKHGYVRGAATVMYVDHVWESYRAYRHASGDRDRKQR